MSIHESSIIHPSAEIDNDVQIGPFCVVGENVKIESGSKLFSHIVLKGPTTIGKNNIFYQSCNRRWKYFQGGRYSSKRNDSR